MQQSVSSLWVQLPSQIPAGLVLHLSPPPSLYRTQGCRWLTAPYSGSHRLFQARVLASGRPPTAGGVRIVCAAAAPGGVTPPSDLTPPSEGAAPPPQLVQAVEPVGSYRGPVLMGRHRPENWKELLKALLRMSRVHNLLPSALMVLLGSWMAVDHDPRVLLQPGIWAVAGVSALIAAASMLANDVFDYRLGTDLVNSPDKPLVSGAVNPDDAELVAGCLYSAAVLLSCLMELRPLRVLMTTSAVLTYIYTPWLKALPVVKNVVVAAVIANSVVAGGLVAAGAAGFQRTVAPALFLFLCILGREILMDVVDMVGDKATGVRTLAVCFGRRAGTMAAAVALASANALLVSLFHFKALAAAGTLILLPLHAKVLKLLEGSSDFSGDKLKMLSSIVDQSMLHIGGSLILLCAAL